MNTREYGDVSVAGVIVGGVIALAISIFLVVCAWRVYTKAGQPGWAAIVPFYNTYVLLKIVGRPSWWLVLFFIPVVNVVVAIIVYVDLATSFGKGGGFVVLLILLPFVGYPMLAFGDATYRGPLADPNYATYGPGGRYPGPGYPAAPHQYPPHQYPPQQYPQQQPPQQYPQQQPPQQHPPQQYPPQQPPQQQPPQE